VLFRCKNRNYVNNVYYKIYAHDKLGNNRVDILKVCEIKNAFIKLNTTYKVIASSVMDSHICS